MPRPKPPCRYSFPSVCIFQSWPLSICSPSLFFFSLPFIHGVIFLSPTVTSSPEAFFSWEAERACIAFSNEEEEFVFFISKVFFSLAVQHPACQHSHYFIFSLIVHPALWVLLWIWVFCFYHFIHLFQNILYHNTFCSQRARQPGI